MIWFTLYDTIFQLGINAEEGITGKMNGGLGQTACQFNANQCPLKGRFGPGKIDIFF